MIRLALACVCLLSSLALCQTAKQTSAAPPNPALSSRVVFRSCSSPSPAMEKWSSSILSSPNFGQNDCAHSDALPVNLDPARDSNAAFTLSNLPDAQSAFWTTSSSSSFVSTSNSMSTTQFVLPALTIEPNTIKGWHTVDREFILLQTFSTLAFVADTVTTIHGLQVQPQATEINPLFGTHPTPARIYSIGVPLHVLNILLSYHAKKVAPRRNVWKFAPRLSIGIHTAAAINNLVVAHQ
jgi:hypothetical protein